MTKTCYICGQPIPPRQHNGRRTICYSQTCIDQQNERLKERRRINLRNHRKRKKQIVEGNGWFCRQCHTPLTGARRFHCADCEARIFSSSSRFDGDWIYDGMAMSKLKDDLMPEVF